MSRLLVLSGSIGMRTPPRLRWLSAAGLILVSVIVWQVVYARGKVSAEKLAAEASAAVKERRWPDAERLLNRLAADRPPTAADLVLRAEVELALGRPDKAIRLLEDVSESDSHAARARLVAGQIEKSRHRARRTESLLLDAIRLDPKLALARRELIFLYGMQARRADLKTQYRALAELEPLGFDEVFLWLNSFENLWINDVIRSFLEDCLKADPDDRTSRLALASVLLHANEIERAEALVKSVAQSDPDARVLRARFALCRHQVDRVQSILSEGPTDHVGLALLRGQFAASVSDSSAAAEQFRIALRREPDNREALQALSVVLKQLGDWKAAASAQKQADQWRHLTSLLQKSKTFDTGNEKAFLVQLGEACEALSQDPEARVCYRLALARDPLDPTLQQALFRVRNQER
jgi:tetratricopeptide (TPR) repeat protein